MRLDHDIEALATRQHALVAIWQLDALGATGQEIDRLRTSRWWTPITPRVLGLRGVGESEDRSTMAAVLDASPGALAARLTSASMWGAPGARRRPIHLLRSRGVARRPCPLAVVHEVMAIHPSHVKELRGIPLTSPARTVFDLAGCVHEDRLERFVDWFWSNRLLDGAALTEVATQLCRRGRTGSRAMRQVVEARGPGYVPPASSLERRFAQVLERHCLPRFRRQVDSGGGDWTGRVDFRHPVLPLVVEVQSERYHAALVDQAADRRRREQLERDGFVVVEVWDTQVWHEPAAVAQAIAKVVRVLEATARLAG